MSVSITAIRGAVLVFAALKIERASPPPPCQQGGLGWVKNIKYEK